jgi:CheY-like chemotaxis protein
MTLKIKKTVLLVEDDPMMIEMYKTKFINEGINLLVAEDGEKGLSILRKLKDLPNVILLDVLMPKMNGYDVLRVIKKDPRTKKIPVLLLTNLAGTSQDITEGKELGATDYLVKSNYTPQQIIEKIKPFLG